MPNHLRGEKKKLLAERNASEKIKKNAMRNKREQPPLARGKRGKREREVLEHLFPRERVHKSLKDARRFREVSFTRRGKKHQQRRRGKEMP